MSAIVEAPVWVRRTCRNGHSLQYGAIPQCMQPETAGFLLACHFRATKLNKFSETRIMIGPKSASRLQLSGLRGYDLFEIVDSANRIGDEQSLEQRVIGVVSSPALGLMVPLMGNFT